MSVNHDLISVENKKLIEQENLNTYLSLFENLQGYGLAYEDSIEVAGVRHYQSPSHGILVKEGDQVLLFHDEGNPYDEYAVKIKNLGNQMIGYIPKDFSQSYSEELEDSAYFEAHVESIYKTEPLYPGIYLSIKAYKRDIRK